MIDDLSTYSGITATDTSSLLDLKLEHRGIIIEGYEDSLADIQPSTSASHYSTPPRPKRRCVVISDTEEDDPDDVPENEMQLQSTPCAHRSKNRSTMDAILKSVTGVNMTMSDGSYLEDSCEVSMVDHPHMCIVSRQPRDMTEYYDEMTDKDIEELESDDPEYWSQRLGAERCPNLMEMKILASRAEVQLVLYVTVSGLGEVCMKTPSLPGKPVHMYMYRKDQMTGQWECYQLSKKVEVCRCYNYSRCRNPRCRYVHRCSTCGGDHKAKQCPQQPLDFEREQMSTAVYARLESLARATEGYTYVKIDGWYHRASAPNVDSSTVYIIVPHIKYVAITAAALTVLNQEYHCKIQIMVCSGHVRADQLSQLITQGMGNTVHGLMNTILKEVPLNISDVRQVENYYAPYDVNFTIPKYVNEKRMVTVAPKCVHFSENWMSETKMNVWRNDLHSLTPSEFGDLYNPSEMFQDSCEEDRRYPLPLITTKSGQSYELYIDGDELCERGRPANSLELFQLYLQYGEGVINRVLQPVIPVLATSPMLAVDLFTKGVSTSIWPKEHLACYESLMTKPKCGDPYSNTFLTFR